MTPCPIFRCLPEDPSHKIDYHHGHAPVGDYRVPTFDRLMFDLDSDATWADAAPIVRAYNLVISERLWLSL